MIATLFRPIVDRVHHLYKRGATGNWYSTSTLDRISFTISSKSVDSQFTTKDVPCMLLKLLAKVAMMSGKQFDSWHHLVIWW
jgi:hypothetical protein